MSASDSAAVLSPGLSHTDVRILRYAVGSTLIMAIALGINWNLAYLTPVLALSFLASPAPRPTVRAGLSFVCVVAVACVAGMWLSKNLLDYPAVYLTFMGLVLLRLFYAKASGRPAMLITWLLIAVLVIPMVAMQSPAIANIVALGIVFGAMVTVVMVWFAHALFPDPGEAGRDAEPEPAAPASAIPPREERLQTALLSTVVVLPVMVLFYMFQWVSSLLILIFIALLSMQPGFAANFKAGLALIIGNVIGGIAAIVVYNLLVIVPEFHFMILLTLLSGLLFGARVFSGTKTAPLYGMAFSTLLLVIGSVTSSEGAAGSAVYTRVMQIMLAVGYVVAAFGLIERLRKSREVVA